MFVYSCRKLSLNDRLTAVAAVHGPFTRYDCRWSLGLSRLCSVTFWQLSGFRTTFSQTSNFEQLFLKLAHFQQPSALFEPRYSIFEVLNIFSLVI